MDFASRAQSPPNSASTTGTKRTRMFLPLSNHGMPRTPLPTSPGGSVKSHRFDKGQRSPATPRSPGSPPMSARTFATFFSSHSYQDSEPSYSPRAPSHFSGTTLASSPQPTPSLPPIPQFEKVEFEKHPVPLFDNVELLHAKRRSRSVPHSPIKEPGTHNIDAHLPQPSSNMTTPPPSSKVTPPPSSKVASPVVSPTDAPLSMKLLREERNLRDAKTDAEIAAERELEAYQDEPAAADPAIQRPATAVDEGPSKGGLSRLSRRLRSVLGSNAEKKALKKMEAKRSSKEAAKKDLDRMEDVHWTEM